MQKKSACGECLAYNADSTEAGLWGRLWNRWQGSGGWSESEVLAKLRGGLAESRAVAFGEIRRGRESHLVGDFAD